MNGMCFKQFLLKGAFAALLLCGGAYNGYFEQPTGTTVNLSAEKELARFGERGGALTLRAEITNLFDGANEIHWGYPGAGRGFYVGLRYGFD